jgi:hypothetical protein
MRDEPSLQTEADVRRALRRANRIADNLSEESDRRLLTTYILELEALLLNMLSPDGLSPASN